MVPVDNPFLGTIAHARKSPAGRPEEATFPAAADRGRGDALNRGLGLGLDYPPMPLRLCR